MAGKLRGKLSYANVMATIAVFVALGGGAYAATHLSKNSVGPKQIRANAVSGPKVKAESLKGSDIKESSLGVVPSATQAASADNASHAADSDALQGHPATDFGAVMSSLMLNAPGLVTPGSNTLYGPVSGMGNFNNNPVAVATLSPQVDLIARDLSVQIKDPPGDADKTLTVTLRVNLSNTGLSCVITGSANSCSDASDTAAVPAGSRIVLEVKEVTNAGPNFPAEYALAGFRLTPN